MTRPDDFFEALSNRAQTRDAEVADAVRNEAPPTPRFVDAVATAAAALRSRSRPSRPELLDWGLASSSFAASAALLLLYALPSSPGPFPDYTSSFSVRAPTVRGPEATTAQGAISLDAVVELRLRPEEAVSGPVTARLYRWPQAKADQPDPLPVAIEVSEQGAARLSASVRSLLGPKGGSGGFVLVLASPDAWPAPQRWRTVAERHPPETTAVVREAPPFLTFSFSLVSGAARP